ncbi:DUF2834 domain-containing protein [Rhodococcus opacus]|uniref:DUF2834 domain-containing protein n=1 Tax=Rhodococcus opacus TaxID=37919 RepID=UPI0029539959|nr:DUF2834 domain-containing protein [Rhodococcus opacus]MDV7089168.1 DUF2834 domain-containing protein [Rhodococcus opacus]
MGELVSGAEGASSLRAVGAWVRGVHPDIVLDQNRGRNRHRGLIRISPCRRVCCEPLDSTHPDTQGSGKYIPAGCGNYASSSFTNDLTLLTLAAVVFMVRRSPQTRYQTRVMTVVLTLAIAIGVLFPIFLIVRERRLSEGDTRGAGRPPAAGRFDQARDPQWRPQRRCSTGSPATPRNPGCQSVIQLALAARLIDAQVPATIT